MDLSKVQVGDKIYSCLKGWGKVIAIHKILFNVKFNHNNNRFSLAHYDYSGRANNTDLNPEITNWRKKRREWKPKSYSDGYIIWTNGDIGSTIGAARIIKEGRVYATKKQAKYAYKSIRACQILNAYKAEFAPGWRPDWNDPEQRKWYVYYNIELEKWGMGYCFKQQSPELVCFSTSIVKQLCKDLNDGVVKL